MSNLKFKISITREQINDIGNIENILKTNLRKKTNLKGDNSTLEDEIKNLLSIHYQDEYGAPEIEHIEFLDFKKGSNIHNGSFNLQFCIYRFFGCSDLNTEDDDYLKIEYTIDQQQLNIDCKSVSITKSEFLKNSI